MKKTWVALAVLGAFAGAASAQSSVTLYGIVDAGYQWSELPTDVNGRVQQESYSSIQSGIQSGSRWGLRGSEDLGGNMKAVFTLESGFDVDTGMSGQSGRLFGRQAWVGLQTGLGTVVLGRIASFSSGTGSFDMIGRIDPFSTGFNLAGAGNTFYSMNALRVDNAIAYQSPKFAGFMVGAAYTTRFDGKEVAPSSSNTDAYMLAANWEAGPFFVAMTYDAFDLGGNYKDQKHFQVGGTFDIGPFRLHAGYADQSNIGAVPSVSGGSGSYLAVPAGLQFDNTAWLLGATWTVGAFKVFGSYQAANADGQQVCTGTSPGGCYTYEPDYNIWALGGTYNLSRRSNLYASYASRNADGTLFDNSFNAKQFSLGMRHIF